MTLLESFNLQDVLIPNSDRPLPDNFHARLGQKLNSEKSQVYEQIGKLEKYAEVNEMKINSDKTKFMLFNPTEKYDFIPEFEIGGKFIETEEEIKILGLVLRNDLKWRSNTDSMVSKAYSRMWMIKRLKKAGANLKDLTEVYTKQIRCVLEFGVPVWNSGITQEEIYDIERVQKTFLYIVLGPEYVSYENALDVANLETLQSRRHTLCQRFANKTAKHPKHHHWFQKNNSDKAHTRSKKFEYKQPLCRLSRFKRSPVPYLSNLRNSKTVNSTITT